MPSLALSDGTPTGGIYGFAAIAMEIVHKLSPDQVVVAWDSKTSGAKRRALYPEYKAGRIKPGEDFYAQIPLLKQLILDLGWSFVELDEYEADDIIGTLAKTADALGDYETYIISSDLDMLQIVDENTHMWRILKGFTNIEEISVPELEEKYGIKKPQFLDLKALKGDSSDNIPGVPGIGEKTAAKLLNEFGSLDGIYEHLSAIPGATKKKLEAGKDSAYLSKTLARIMFDAPVDLESLSDFTFNRGSVIAGLKKLEFNSLIRRVEKEATANESAVKSSGSTPVISPKDKAPVMNQSAVISSAPSSAEPVENPVENSEETPVKIPPKDDIIIAWDIKSLMHSDAKIAAEILAGKPFWDLSQAAFLLNPLKKEPPRLVDLREEYETELAALAKTPKLYEVLTKFDLPLIPVLYQMEKKGMLIDRPYFENLKQEYEKEVTRLEQTVFTLAGREFNLKSPFQIADILFDTLGLPKKGIKKTARGYSTGVKELEKLKNLHPIVPAIMEYREAAKLLSTYILPIPDLADQDNRIHTTFTQNVTATGRLSSINPNLQNLPVRTEEGKRIRTGFIAPAGKALVSADYSQFELRLAAVLSNDTWLIADFNSDVDIHTKTAAEAFHLPMDAVTKDQRRAAKVVNFGILYGMSVKGLSDATGMSVPEAKQFIDNYFKLRAPIKRKLSEILEMAREKGYVETFYGRRRPTPDVKSPNFVARQAAERAAENMPIQGTEADLMKRAMIAIAAVLPETASLVMQVHDSLIVECDVADTEKITTLLRDKMENVAPELPIKLAVDVTSGSNWGAL